MELSKQLKVIDRKFAYNTGQLPGFSSGLTSSDEYLNNLMLWMDNLQQYNSGNKNVAGAVDTSILPTRGNFDTAGMSAAGQLASRKDIPHLSTEIKKIAKGINIDNIQTAVGGLGQLATGLAGSFNAKSKEEMLAEYHPVQRTVAGRSYTALSKAKDGKLPGYSLGNIANSTIGGATAGSVGGLWGTVFGGAAGFLGGVAGTLISGKKEEENRRTVANWVKSYNNGERNNTISQVMGENNQSLYGNQYTQSLIPHAIGKLPKYNNRKPVGEPTWTVEGPVFNGPKAEPNSRVEDNEIAYNKAKGVYTNIDGLPNDGSYAHLSNSDGILSARPGIAGISPADLFRTTGNIDLAEQYMVASNAAKGKKMYKCGKLPRHAEGWLGNGIPSLFGTIAGLGQYLDAKNNTPYRPHSYVANPYETSALNTLAGLRINPYPITRELRDAEARANRAIDIAGGLSGSQRTAARLAALNTTQGNISKLLSDIQQQNNAYKANYAQAAINAGQASRQARMAANQWDLDYYSKAHAARNKGIQTGIANMLSQIQQYQANEFKRRQFNETMDLYRDDMDLRKKYMNWMQNHSGLNISQNADPIKNPSSQYWNQLLPSEKWLALYNRGIIG